MIGILDYGMGNLMSVSNALDYLKLKSIIIEDPEEIKSLSHLIIPGVGAFPYAMEIIRSKELFDPILDFANTGKPLLGVCLGMQLLATHGDEITLTDGLGLISGRVSKLETNFRIPHMGWNGLNIERDHPILKGVKKDSDVYFVHSYCFQCTNESDVLTSTEYGVSFSSVIANKEGNVIGAQFHPEKSQKQGLRILKNFSEM